MEKTQIPEVLKSHLLQLYQIALADGEFSRLELKMLYGFAEERGVTKAHLDEILLNPTAVDNLIPEEVNEKLGFLYDFSAMIWADNVVTDDERSALEKYIKRFGFLEENTASLADYLIEAIQVKKTKQEIINELNH